MSRAVLLDPPETAFRYELKVSPSDIDIWGHVNNVAWVQWVQDVAVTHSAAVGLDVARYRELGLGWVVRRHEIEYLAPAYESEDLVVLTWIACIGKSSSERCMIFRRASDGAPLVRASTLWVMVDATGRPTRIPDLIKESFESPL